MNDKFIEKSYKSYKITYDFLNNIHAYTYKKV